MELANIEKLIKKYENAETTLKEEEVLREYFLSDKVATHLEEYQTMFTYFQISRNETYNGSIKLNTRRRSYRWLSIVASVTLLFSVYVGNAQYQKYKLKKQYAQVEEALKLIATNLKKGQDAFETLNTYDDAVSKVIGKETK